jgi:uncharacterized repeat protein (TIGR01451 family)
MRGTAARRHGSAAGRAYAFVLFFGVGLLLLLVRRRGASRAPASLDVARVAAEPPLSPLLPVKARSVPRPPARAGRQVRAAHLVRIAVVAAVAASLFGIASNSSAQTIGVDLAVLKSDFPDPVTVGQDLTYTVDVFNEGDQAATNVVITDTLPAGVTFVSATASFGGSCSEAGGVVTCNRASFPQFSFERVTIVVRPTADGTIRNRVSVTSAEPDADTTDNAAVTQTTVGTVTAPFVDLALTKSDNRDPATVGEDLTYFINVSNPVS